MRDWDEFFAASASVDIASQKTYFSLAYIKSRI